MVGTARFELATSRTPSVRATRLRYVPTASAPRLRSRKPTNLTVSLAFEQRQQTAQCIAQIQQRAAAEQLDGGFGVAETARLFAFGFGEFAQSVAQMAPCARDGEALIVKQATNLQHQVDIFLAIQAMPALVLHRLKHREFALPI